MTSSDVAPPHECLRAHTLSFVTRRARVPQHLASPVGTLRRPIRIPPTPRDTTRLRLTEGRRTQILPRAAPSGSAQIP